MKASILMYKRINMKIFKNIKEEYFNLIKVQSTQKIKL